MGPSFYVKTERVKSVGPPRKVRLDELTIEQRYLILALVEAMRHKNDPSEQHHAE
ncbi:MAG TPA: hypothetical protein VFE45_16950 [Coriobacteriia bacterium]|nr:hypothetical protein [Coriobacteriia bacterium]